MCLFFQLWVRRIFYSYCLPLYKLEIIAFPHRHSMPWTFNSHSLQGLTSNVCSHYCCIYALNEIEIKYVSIYLKNDLKPQVKFGTSSGHVLLNDVVWFIVVILKSIYPKMKYTNLVTLVKPCLCIVDVIFVSRVRTPK